MINDYEKAIVKGELPSLFIKKLSLNLHIKLRNVPCRSSVLSCKLRPFCHFLKSNNELSCITSLNCLKPPVILKTLVKVIEVPCRVVDHISISTFTLKLEFSVEKIWIDLYWTFYFRSQIQGIRDSYWGVAPS